MLEIHLVSFIYQVVIEHEIIKITLSLPSIPPVLTLQLSLHSSVTLELNFCSFSIHERTAEVFLHKC